MVDGVELLPTNTTLVMLVKSVNQENDRRAREPFYRRTGYLVRKGSIWGVVNVYLQGMDDQRDVLKSISAIIDLDVRDFYGTEETRILREMQTGNNADQRTQARMGVPLLWERQVQISKGN